MKTNLDTLFDEIQKQSPRKFTHSYFISKKENPCKQTTKRAE